MSLRISTASLSGLVKEDLQQAFARMVRVQEQVSTGKRINRLSDDAVGAVRVLDLRSFEASLDQYEKNINSSIPFLAQGDVVLDEVEGVLIRAKELALAMASDINSGQQRLTAAVEVRQLFLQVLSLANTKVENRFIFAGFKNGATPFAEGSGGVTFSGDGGEISIQANASRTIKTNLTGNKVFQGAEVTGGVGLFDVLLDLETVLKGGSATNSLSMAVNLNSSTTAGTGFTPADAIGTEATEAAFLAEADFSTKVTVHDSLGTAHDLTFVFAKTAGTTYKVRALAKSSEITGGTAGNLFQVGLEETLSFNGDGTFNAGGSTLKDISITGLTNGANNITITAANQSFAGSTQLSQTSSVLTLSQTNTNGFNPQLGRLDAALDQVLNFRAELGARLNAAEGAKDGLESTKIQTIGQRSQIEDTDTIEVISKFARLRQAFEVALQSASQVITPSLLDFIR